MANITSDYAPRRNYAVSTPYGPQGTGGRSGPYVPAGAQMMQAGHNDAMGSLGHAFSTMSMASPHGNYGNRGSSHVPASSSDYAMNHSAMYHVPATGNMGYAANPMIQSAPSGQVGAMYPHHNHYMPHNNYAVGYAQAGGHDGSHAAPSWTTSRVPSDATHSTMPTLITPRRGSVSSTEDHIPATPYNNYGGYHSGVAILDRSPSGHYTNNTTPSPSQYISPYGAAKVYNVPPIPMHMQMLLKQEPPIPTAIPAPSSPVKPLDRCLENKNGETNVYIRGLLPETTDDMLHEWGGRFGDIASSKSIIDHKTQLCKGFGFIKYHNFEDAEGCIRGFHHLGYEVSFARESFYSKLKKFSDEQNTNLYVSNIPRNFNEHELSNVFVPYKVCSARILRDERGNGRGVGFARFESRDVCDEIIENFNNFLVKKAGVEDHIIQIRFSDTMEQKNLKQQTAAARQFRAAEFEFGCSQALHAGVLPPSSAERIQAQHLQQGYTGSDGTGYDMYMPQGAGASVYAAPQTLGTARRNLMPYPSSSSPMPTIKSESSVKAESGTSTTGGEVTNGEGSCVDRSATPVLGHKTLVKASPSKNESPGRLASAAV